MKSIYGMVVVAILCAILSGCAHKINFTDGPFDNQGQPINFMVTPVESLGVKATDGISGGQVTIIEGPLADKAIASEMYPGRFRWNGLVVTENGQEFFAQFVLVGMYKSGEYMFSIVIDGEKQKVKNGKVVMLSSLGDFVCNLAGGQFWIDAKRFRMEKEYRKEVIWKYGTKVGSRREMSGFEKNIRSWNKYATKQGDIFTPYGDEDVKRIARINPGYNLLEKIVLKGNITISSNPIYTMWTIGFSIIEGMTTRSQGWDYMSQIPDRQLLGEIVEFIGKFRLEVIRQLNEEKATLEADALKKVEALKVVPFPTTAPIVLEKKTKKKEARR